MELAEAELAGWLLAWGGRIAAELVRWAEAGRADAKARSELGQERVGRGGGSKQLGGGVAGTSSGAGPGRGRKPAGRGCRCRWRSRRVGKQARNGVGASGLRRKRAGRGGRSERGGGGAGRGRLACRASEAREQLAMRVEAVDGASWSLAMRRRRGAKRCSVDLRMGWAGFSRWPALAGLWAGYFRLALF
jgi:hypothetical protein